MTPYKERLRAGYYQDGLTKQEQQAIADKAASPTRTRKTTSRRSSKKAK